MYLKDTAMFHKVTHHPVVQTFLFLAATLLVPVTVLFSLAADFTLGEALAVWTVLAIAGLIAALLVVRPDWPETGR